MRRWRRAPPTHIVEQIIGGQIEKFYRQTVLLEQPYVRTPDVTVGELVAERIAKFRENIRIRRFARFGVKDEDDE